MGIKVHHVVKDDGSHYAWLVACPACRSPHSFDGRWTFVNNDHERPTFTASMLVHAYDAPELPPSDKHPNGLPAYHRDRCHSVLTDGVWHYCDDSQHALAGKSAPAPDWDDRKAWDWA